MIGIHGAGGHASVLWPFVAASGAEAIAIDLPLYGRTTFSSLRRRRQTTYEHWVELLVDFVNAQRKPVVLFGMSIGGILAGEVAKRCPQVKRTVATCLVECSDPVALRYISNFGMLSFMARPLTLLIGGPLRRIEVPMRWLAKMSAMSSNPELTKCCLQDPLSGKVKVPLGFLKSLVQYQHSPTSQVVLAHPENDLWTPLHLSTKQAHVQLAVLPACGHLPVEEPGVSLLVELIKPAG
ncbi:MAG: alpha/beta fold hydrolase [Actinomycetaceae bacterium]|nr:alpha/beta fold hydrolase [Actinomycetaceae bacterium]